MIVHRREPLPDTSLDVDLILIVLGTTALVILLAARTTVSRGVLLAIVATALVLIAARVVKAWHGMKHAARPSPLLGRPVGFMMVASIAAGMVATTLVHVPDWALILHMVVTLLVGQVLETRFVRRVRT